MSRPDNVTDEHLEFLDELRDSGVTNMYGAAVYIQNQFMVKKIEAGEILQYWMDTFGQEDR